MTFFLPCNVGDLLRSLYPCQGIFRCKESLGSGEDMPSFTAPVFSVVERRACASWECYNVRDPPRSCVGALGRLLVLSLGKEIPQEQVPGEGRGPTAAFGHVTGASCTSELSNERGEPHTPLWFSAPLCHVKEGPTKTDSSLLSFFCEPPVCPQMRQRSNDPFRFAFT